ncbi:hypothetical protein EVAR_83853_1 [Eumeta japonica]|uniref:Uncharacterized protein n=1 Tax=Eumeta variegata TaxID=151549 RepID=A0A4C1UT11_EUMVA|nr:hypothetical protein EVAR_83853_1 [Eumeta japonica]
MNRSDCPVDGACNPIRAAGRSRRRHSALIPTGFQRCIYYRLLCTSALELIQNRGNSFSRLINIIEGYCFDGRDPIGPLSDGTADHHHLTIIYRWSCFIFIWRCAS